MVVVEVDAVPVSVVAVIVAVRVGVVADSVLVTVFAAGVAVVLEVAVAAVAVSALVVVVEVVCDADCVAAVGVVSLGAVGGLTLVVLLVICVSVLEMLLAMLDAPPEPHPAIRTVTMPASAIL